MSRLRRNKKNSFARSLRFTVRLQEQVGEGHNDYGDPDYVFSDIATLKADVRPVSGREYLLSEQMEQNISHTVFIRSIPGQVIDTSMRFLWHDHRRACDRVLEIVSAVDVDERGGMMEIRCLETFR